MDQRTLFIVLSLVLSISSYNIKINPIVKTQVQSIKNSGDQNTIQLASITNSTILQVVPPSDLSVPLERVVLHVCNPGDLLSVVYHPLSNLNKGSISHIQVECQIINKESVIFSDLAI